MIKLKDLKVGDEYYIIGEDGCFDPILIKFRVINKLKGGVKKGYVEIQYLVYLDDECETPVKYYDQKENEVIIEKLYVEDEYKIFEITDLEKANRQLNKVIEKHELDMCIHNIENHIPPHEYPDWDGDESIMYYIENYNDEYDECDENIDSYYCNYKGSISDCEDVECFDCEYYKSLDDFDDDINEYL